MKRLCNSALYTILERKNLNLTGVIKAYALKTYQNRPTLILEDIGGESLVGQGSTFFFTLPQ